MTDVYHDLSVEDFEQDWTDTSQITTDNSWSGVPSIVGFRGDNLATTGTLATSITADDGAGVVNVEANETTPSTFGTGGVAEFQIANPVVGFQGSGTADAPNLKIYLNATGRQNVVVSFDARDIDTGADTTQQLNVQYRVGTTGVWTNVEGGYFADVAAAGDTLVTPVSVVLPAAADNQAQLQVRILTVDAAGADQFIGIDNIVVSSEPAGGGGGDATVSIGDVTISEGDAGTSIASFTVTRTDDSDSFTVRVDTANGTATAGSDYEAISNQTLTFEAGGTLTQEVQVVINGDTTTEPNETFTVSLSNLVNTVGTTTIADGQGAGTITNDDVTVVRVYDIQGAGHRSSFVGQTVTTVGIVTAIDNVGQENGANNPQGFWVQDATGDGDYRTSDAVFVFLGTGASVTFPTGVAVGAEVRFTASVSEFLSGQQLSVTQLGSVSGLTVLSMDNDLPTAVRVGNVNDLATGLERRPELEDLGDDDGDATPDVPSTYDPVNQGSDFWESLEGMRVVLEDVRITSPFRSNFDEQFATPNVGVNPSANDRGGLTIRDATPDVVQPADKLFDLNPERIQLDDEAGFVLPTGLETGDRLGDVTGVVSYGNGQYEVNATQAYGPVVKANLEREETTLTENLDRVRVASFNVENLAPVGATVDGQPTPQSKYDALAEAVVNNLDSPEIIALQEVLDNDGATNSAVVSASETLSQLIDAIVAKGGPRYVAIDSVPVDDTVGGIPGGNQRVAYLYNPEAVTPTGRNGLTTVSTDADGVKVQSFPTEDQIGQGDSDFGATRKSLPIEWSPAGYSDAQGGTFYTVNSHFSSKGGSAPLYGQNLDLPLYADPLNGSAQAVGTDNEREGQAELVNAFIDGVLADASSTNDRFVALGDFNDFQFFPVVDLVTGALVRTTANPDGTASLFAPGTAVLSELEEKLAEADRYSFNFDGNSQGLDHVLVSNNLFADALIDIVHINSEFAEQVSDHDPSIASLRFLRSAAIATGGDDDLDQRAFDAAFTGAQASRADLTGDDTFDGLGGNDRLVGYAGDDSLFGGTGEDSLVGGLGDDFLNGGNGVDTAAYDDRGVGAATVDLDIDGVQNVGRGGLDTLVSIENLVGGRFGDLFRGDEQANVLLGAAGGDQLFGRAGGDTLVGEEGDDTLDGAEGLDTLSGGAGLDRLFGGDDADRLFGAAGDDSLLGGAGDDEVFGDEDADRIFGGDGADRLYGGEGDDILVGGLGVDVIVGGLGADRFVYDFAFESTRGAMNRDRIVDFDGGQGDIIDLRGIDAVAGGEDDMFDFVADFTGEEGQLRLVVRGGVTLVQGDIDGNGATDFEIVVGPAEPLTVDSFLL